MIGPKEAVVVTCCALAVLAGCGDDKPADTRDAAAASDEQRRVSECVDSYNGDDETRTMIGTVLHGPQGPPGTADAVVGLWDGEGYAIPAAASGFEIVLEDGDCFIYAEHPDTGQATLATRHSGNWKFLGVSSPSSSIDTFRSEILDGNPQFNARISYTSPIADPETQGTARLDG